MSQAIIDDYRSKAKVHNYATQAINWSNGRVRIVKEKVSFISPYHFIIKSKQVLR